MKNKLKPGKLVVFDARRIGYKTPSFAIADSDKEFIKPGLHMIIAVEKHQKKQLSTSGGRAFGTWCLVVPGFLWVWVHGEDKFFEMRFV